MVQRVRVPVHEAKLRYYFARSQPVEIEGRSGQLIGILPPPPLPASRFSRDGDVGPRSYACNKGISDMALTFHVHGLSNIPWTSDIITCNMTRGSVRRSQAFLLWLIFYIRIKDPLNSHHIMEQ